MSDSGEDAPSTLPVGMPSDSIALGVFIPPDDPTRIDHFISMVGEAPATVMWFEGWSGHPRFPSKKADAVTSRGAMPMITWEPWDHTRGRSQPQYALRTIVAGEHDAYIRQWARGAAAWGKPVYLRFAHEMNGDWYPWSPGVNGNTSAEYVSAWRHVHTIFVEEGAVNVRWVWAPNYDGPTPLADVYPGDAYTDWVGISAYNWGPLHSPWLWTPLSEILEPSYRAITMLTSKPIMIAEMGSTEVGGDKAAWIRRGLLRDVPSEFPRIRAVIWFNIDKETDWRVNSSPADLAAYREVAASPLYQGRLN